MIMEIIYKIYWITKMAFRAALIFLFLGLSEFWNPLARPNVLRVLGVIFIIVNFKLRGIELYRVIIILLIVALVLSIFPDTMYQL